MCGIAGIHRRTNRRVGNLPKMSQALLRGIENRGHDATGVLCAFDGGDWWLRKDTVPAKKFIRKGRTYAREARTTLLHTRFATKGSPWSKANAHPILDADEKVAVVHNGVLWNDDEVFETFGLRRVAETDTEAIPALIGHVGWDEAGDALALVDGSMAIAAVHRDRPGDLLLARSESSPLFYTVTRDLVVWASSEHAIVQGFKAAGLRAPGRAEIEYMPEMHLMRVNGKVGEPERFAPDPPPFTYKHFGYTSYAWEDEAWGVGSAGGKPGTHKVGGGRLKSSLPPAQPPAVRTPVQVEPFPELSVYEDIAIDVLIANGYTTDEAVDEVTAKGWEVAGLSLEELDTAADDEAYLDAWEAPHELLRPLTLVGDVAMAAIERRSRAGLDD